MYAFMIYMPCIFLTPFFTEIYIVEQLILQTIYLINKDIILQCLGLKYTIYYQEQFQINTGYNDVLAIKIKLKGRFDTRRLLCMEQIKGQFSLQRNVF